MSRKRVMNEADGLEMRLLHAVGVACRRKELCRRYGLTNGGGDTYLKEPRDVVVGHVLVLQFERPADLMDFVGLFIGHGEDKRRRVRRTVIL